MDIKNVCVFCGSSSACDDHYLAAAAELGALLVENGYSITYGGGSLGPMGFLADAALAKGGSVTGVIPEFMCEVEWDHKGLTKLIVTDSMHSRKHRMVSESDAVIAMPGGCGTMEELLEVITLKRLGKFTGPVVFVNTNGFFKPLIDQLEKCISENFMDPRHRGMWNVVDSPVDVIHALENAEPWHSNAIEFAAIKTSKQ